MSARFKKGMLFCLITALVLVLAACASDNANNSSQQESKTSASETPAEGTETDASASDKAQTTYPLTVSNYTSENGTWVAKEQTFDKAPERVVANTQGAAELLVRLGLTDKIVGVAALFGNVSADIADEFKKIPVLAEGYVGKEVTIGASPDLVMGRGGLFEDADWGVGTVNSLNDMSIKTYVQNTSVTGASLDSLYKDITELGEIFNVQAKAAAYVEQLKVREEALKARASSETINYASFSDNGDGTIGIYNGNGDTFIESAMSLINMHNMLIDETGTLSLEKLIEVNPDVMIISRYAGGIDPEETIKKLLANKQVQNINAVKNKKIFIIDFNNFWGYGDSIFTGVEALADDMGL
ncbi:ABC transporter substrate-binding protein [Paenibacillus sp. F6_3S_P_1C]|uniref:ABC transporter substrate-binding protein n=1 Tax=Paenibacillus vandeheii TaxID=3035917 RepID=A0ABT8JD35_9BACL|nr:ABC transporter substrate-binding protein [Paenibacillus vandeheii]MDN4603008.1 ABC transporter substrate-binding protein [Paenibacillus vandeheii]